VVTQPAGPRLLVLSLSVITWVLTAYREFLVTANTALGDLSRSAAQSQAWGRV